MALDREMSAKWQKLHDRVRRVEQDPKPASLQITHTVIVGGPITTDLYIPPMRYQGAQALWDISASDVQSAYIIEQGDSCRVGSVSITWLLDGTDIDTLDQPVRIPAESWIRPQIATVTGDPEDLSAWILIRYHSAGA